MQVIKMTENGAVTVTNIRKNKQIFSYLHICLYIKDKEGKLKGTMGIYPEHH